MTVASLSTKTNSVCPARILSFGFFDGAAQLTPDERSYMAIGREGDVVFRNLADASQTKVDLGVLEAYNAFFSPDGKLLAVTSSLGFAKVWDVATWKLVATIGGFLNGVKPSSFSRDGKRLAIASNDKEAVRLCDTDSWQDVLTLENQGTGAGGVSFSPDGNNLFGETAPTSTSGARHRGRTSSRRRQRRKRTSTSREPDALSRPRIFSRDCRFFETNLTLRASK